MNDIIQKKELLQQSLFQKLSHKENIDNAIIEVNNLLADKPILEIKQDDIQELETKYNVNISTKFSKELYDYYVQHIEYFSDNNILQDKEKEVNYFIELFKLDVDQAKTLYDKHLLLWKLQNEDIPIVDCNIALQKNELCHFITDITWREYRKVTKRVNYGGVGVRFKIVKGVYFRTGSISPQRISEDALQKIDEGKLYITNKRIIFMGSTGNKTINFNKILDYEVFSNGIEISKDAGKNPFFEFDDVDVCSIILPRIINKE